MTLLHLVVPTSSARRAFLKHINCFVSGFVDRSAVIAAFAFSVQRSAFWAVPPTYLTGKTRPAASLSLFDWRIWRLYQPTLIVAREDVTGSLNNDCTS